MKHLLVQHLNGTNYHLNMPCLSIVTTCALNAKRLVDISLPATNVHNSYSIYSLTMVGKQDVLSKLVLVTSMILVN